MKSIKTMFSKLLSLVFALLFAAGCASVTDANIEPNQPEIEQVDVSQSDDTWDNRAGDDMDPIFGDRPSSSQ